MYQFSRAIYLETRDLLSADDAAEAVEVRREVLAACQRTVERLAEDARYFPEPARSLFSDIRHHFPIQAQERVCKVVERYMAAAIRFVEQEAERALREGGIQCRAQTRKGTACQRTPLPGKVFCPSHAHLESIVA